MPQQNNAIADDDECSACYTRNAVGNCRGPPWFGDLLSTLSKAKRGIHPIEQELLIWSLWENQVRVGGCYKWNHG